jgi:hypothetical protein
MRSELKTNDDRISFYLPSGMHQEIRTHAKELSARIGLKVSVNAWLQQTVLQRLQVEKSA